MLKTRQNMSKYKLYLNDILRAIDLIEKSTKEKEFNEFKSNMELIDASAMRIQIIGESLKKLSKLLKEKYKKVDWERYIQTRNIISHAYFAVNTKIIWSIIKDEIPKLKKAINEVIKNEKTKQK